MFSKIQIPFFALSFLFSSLAAISASSNSAQETRDALVEKMRGCYGDELDVLVPNSTEVYEAGESYEIGKGVLMRFPIAGFPVVVPSSISLNPERDYLFKLGCLIEPIIASGPRLEPPSVFGEKVILPLIEND
jgi:hypothetical protein